MKAVSLLTKSFLLLYFPKFQLGTEMVSWDIGEKVAEKLILKTLW